MRGQGVIPGASGSASWAPVFDLPEEEARRLNVDLTPAMVAVLLVASMVMEDPAVLDAEVIADPGAGGGAWGVAVRLVWEHLGRRKPHLIAVEVRGEERRHLESIYDQVFVGRFEDFIAEVSITIDALIGNPPFNPAFSVHWWRLARHRLSRAARVFLYGNVQFGAGKCHAAGLREWPPSMMHRVGGRVHHRLDRGGSLETGGWHFINGERVALADGERLRFDTIQLQPAPKSWRRWSEQSVPGYWVPTHDQVEEAFRLL